MVSVALIFFFGLFDSSPASFPEERFIRVTAEQDLPDLKRTREIKARPGYRSALFGQSKFGNRPGRCDVLGEEALKLTKKKLGAPLTMERLGQKQSGYFWKLRENPGKGFLILVEENPPAVRLRGWSFHDLAPTSRLGTDIEGRIYRWFDELTGR